MTLSEEGTEKLLSHQIASSSAHPFGNWRRFVRRQTPALMFGLRLWTAVCLALYVAFWLQLDNAYWAASSAALVCQPSLGASLRKGWFRLVGTCIGAIAILALTVCFPQQRAAFLIGLALWGAACCLVATLLRNFASYAASLAGYTAAIIAIDLLGSTGGASGSVLMLVISRAGEICIGIVCAGVVLAATDLGAARRRVIVEVMALSSEITDRLIGIMSLGKSDLQTASAVWRDLARRIGALDATIDVAIGESPDLRLHLPELQTIVVSLFSALASWRGIGVHLEWLPEERRRRETAHIASILPQEGVQLSRDNATNIGSFLNVRSKFAKAARRLIALKDPEPSFRLLADQTLMALINLQRAVDNLLVLIDSTRRVRRRPIVRFVVPDLLPPLLNAGRAFVTIIVMAWFWILTGWPNGAEAMAFTAIAVILFSTRSDQAYTATMSFIIGVGLTTVCAAVVEFFILPRFSSFVGLSFAMGLVLIPAGALMTVQTRFNAVFIAMTGNFVPLLAPANQMSYDLRHFCNVALAIFAGAGVGAAAFRLLPPMSPALQARRLLSLVLRDLRRVATHPATSNRRDWVRRTYGRLAALPEQAEPQQRGQLLSALAVGCGIDSLRHTAPRFGLMHELEPALLAVAEGRSLIAVAQLGRFDESVAAISNTEPGATSRLRARGQVIAVSEALLRHQDYFDQGEAV